MNYTFDFIERVRKIDPDGLIRYLKASNWKELDKPGYQGVKIFQIFQRDTMYQANVPVDRTLSDYDWAMCYAVEQIASALDRINSIDRLVTELANPSSDIIWFQIKKASSNSGAIGCNAAIDAYINAEKLVKTASLDLTDPSEYHLSGRQETDSKETLQNCMFGQTAVGSYVVPLIIPLSKSDESNRDQMTLNDEAVKPTNRKISDKIIESIQQVKDSIDNNTLKEVMTSRNNKNPPFSANFLEALSAIGISEEQTEVNISVQRTPTVKSNKPTIDQVSLTNKYYEPIITVVQAIKKKHSTEEKTFIGKISKLDANYDADKRTEGKITIVYIDNGNKRKTAKIMLPKEKYDIAINAHAKGADVKVVGIISGHKIKNIECSDFSIVR